MRILIDCTQIPLTRTGVGVYADELLKKLPNAISEKDTLYALIQDDDVALKEQLAHHKNIRVLLVTSRLLRNRLALGLYEQLILPWVLLYHKIDVVHSLHYTHPLVSPCPRVVTLHDMTFFVVPQMHTRARKLIMAFFIKKALHSAEVIAFVSDSTKTDAGRLFGNGRNIRLVTPLGVDPSIFTNFPQKQTDDTLFRLHINKPYILYVGTLEPRKNIEHLIRAFENIKQYNSSYILVIAGKLGWNYKGILKAIEESSSKENILRLGYISTEDKPILIAACNILVYPSIYEGFGLPVLEGMAAGVPVITSSTSSLSEVAGQAAVLVDPGSIEQLAAAMELVLSNTKYAESLRRAGRSRARDFSWEKTARLTYKAYEMSQRAKADSPAAE